MSLFTHALSTNNYGPFKIVVAKSAANGTHTTMNLAIAAAVAGDTVYVRDGVYTENWTGKAGVTVCSMVGNENTPNVTFNGEITYSDAGIFTITGCRLQTNNGVSALQVVGSNASTVFIQNCNLHVTINTPAISFTNSNAGSSITVINSIGDLASSGASFYNSTSPGSINFFYFISSNTGGSAIASVCRNGLSNWEYCSLTCPVGSEGTGGLGIFFSIIDTEAQNVIAVRANGTGPMRFEHSDFISGLQPCISIGPGAIALTSMITVNSSVSAGNAITGAGVLFYNHIGFAGASPSRNINTATQINTNSGTFVPVLAFGGASVGITYGSQFGKYFRDGNLITFALTLTLTSKGTSTGLATLTGLPFAAASDGNNYDFCMLILSVAAPTATGFFGDLPSGSQVIGLNFTADPTGTFATLSDANFTNTTVMRIQGSYFI